jgi:hypothetical protein
MINITGKGKGHPRTGYEDSEEEQKYGSSLSSDLILALDGGRW